MENFRNKISVSELTEAGVVLRYGYTPTCILDGGYYKYTQYTILCMFKGKKERGHDPHMDKKMEYFVDSNF